ncbi:MAG: glycine betaine ABC transporter substrate-binding protein [Actinomycetota bacterium]|nr:glycine betaine ABC transporter substrate-binding protein [Actinomycetota bacterium]
MNKATLRVVGLLAVLTMAVAGCGGGGGTGGGGGGSLSEVDLSDATIVVGSKDFTEQQILGHITLQALEATGATVEDRIGLAGTDAARAALDAGDIDTYWEYTGTNWINHLKNTKPIPDPVEQYDAVVEAEKKNDIAVLERAPANNTYALAVRSEAAEDLGVEKLSDIKKVIEERPEDATVCVESEFNSRDDGLPGMEKTYGFEFPKENIKLFDTGVVYTETDKGEECNFGEVFITDGRIPALDLTVIEDDKKFFPVYNPALNVRQEIYDEYGEQLDQVFTPIAQAMENDTLAQMNAAVDVDGELPEDVAEEWLTKNGFVE